VSSWDDTAPPAWDDAPVAAEPRYAGFWIRFVAYVIDAIIVGLTVGLAVAVGLIATGVIDVNDGSGRSGGGGDGGGLLIMVVYFVICWAVWQRTLGYRVLGLRLVKADGTPVTWGTSVIRGLMFVVSSIPLGLGLIWAGFNREKQGWHDKAAGTYVIYDR
jgi:uncharacterized RDD family membrane protein YckC